MRSIQLELDLNRPFEPDRHFEQGGRSFYFFDFDDNVAFLSTPIILFHRDTGAEHSISPRELALHRADISHRGKYQDYFLDYNDDVGSFRFFRDQELTTLEKSSRQPFHRDIEQALSRCEMAWKAPSWNCFYYATFNRRPISVITARGHHAKTIKSGIDLMVKAGHLPHRPNYLSVFPVSHPQVRKDLGMGGRDYCVASLKQLAIRHSVEKAIERYGYSPFHRFGMSDDDPKNIEMITEEMKKLKEDYPEMSFFVIQTEEDHFVKREVSAHGTRGKGSFHLGMSAHSQLALF